MNEIILHHFPRSPFAEKVRLALGFKGARWRSVEVPAWPPKPGLMPLTGGYRRTPVMQIGADVYCDTRIILRELDIRFPQTWLHSPGPGELIGAWADSALFVNTVNVVFGTFIDKLPQALQDDRRDSTGGLFDAERSSREQPALRAALCAYLAWIENAFADGRAFVTGRVVNIADFSLYHPLWWTFGAFPRGAGNCTRRGTSVMHVAIGSGRKRLSTW
jgi:glutathione S-transferase